MKSSQCLASDTLVRTTTGVKRVGDVQPDDYLYDAGNRPSLCLGVAPPATGQLKEIMYTEFDSRATSSFTCTPDHRLTLTAGCRLYAYIETVLDQRYHPGHQDKYSKYIDDYLVLAHAPGLVREAREAIYDSMDSYLEQLSTRRAEAEEVDSTDEVFEDVGSTDDVFDIDEWYVLWDPNVLPAEYSFPEKPFVELDLPSSQSTHSYVPSSQPPPPDDEPRSNSPLSDSSSMYPDIAHADRSAAVRESLDSINCDCGGLRKVLRRFKTEEQAELALKILQSDLHHLIDPLTVTDGEEVSMTVEEYERLCCEIVKGKYLKVYRVPLALDPSAVSAYPQALPGDPYFLGLWLGDGTVNTTAITAAASDRETRALLYLAENLDTPAGTELRNEYVTNSDVFQYRIVCSQARRYARNPVRDGLRELGLLHDKSGGIPSKYMEADEDTRLAVIAGPIDSDGSYRKSHNTYQFSQSTEGHKQIVYDLKKLANSRGISVTGVNLEMRRPGFGVEAYAYLYRLSW
ncbi:hypothetical protein POJ06DRAFT_274773 [Lipomyces tetrasporus]|uniref:DOD-type homing endonuclease domain-containing protein n=1 Tax=Lipomyces tetrasporus TaxID=54092 RepID=A0AAD7VUB1_9ASCO|nr:uncharacterized protein POJ06DRAFT_274773 [Lipomyces tetrasporus]KAJ8101005.1 hypothetical protein POJ06DRAFT_274773 [Lipomyces tetrasporus]